jgi:hypothetical protein
MKKLTIIIFLSTLLSCNISCGPAKNSDNLKESPTKKTISNSVIFQETPKKLTTLVDRIVKINEVQYEHIGVAGTASENYKNFKHLEEIATTDELVELTNNKNATVACYASWALADKSYSNLKSIFNKFLIQDRQVQSFNGCDQYLANISFEIYHRYWNNLDDEKKSTDKILTQLDSIIIFSKKPYWLLLRRALENRVYVEPYKTQISILAFEQGQREAIFYLCTWHKAEYADKIKTSLVKYLNETEFKNTGTTDYYNTVEELFKFNDPEIRKAIIAKMKKDRHWEMEKGRFKYLLEDNYIYDIDNE